MTVKGLTDNLVIKETDYLSLSFSTSSIPHLGQVPGLSEHTSLSMVQINLQTLFSLVVSVDRCPAGAEQPCAIPAAININKAIFFMLPVL